MMFYRQLKWRQALAAVVMMSSVGVAAQQVATAVPQSDAVKTLLAERACVGCNLAGAVLTPADLTGVNLTGANMFEANLYFANLEKANLGGANLVNANLGKARLKDANLAGADLTGANLLAATDVNLDGATTTATTTCPDGAAGPCR